MSSRVTEKQRRKAERLERDRRAAQAAARVRRLRSLAWAFGFVAVVAAVMVAVFSSGSGGGGKGGPFGTQYEGLEQRRLAAGVPTRAEAGGSAHLHPRLAIFVNGRRVGIPVGIGIDPDKPASEMASLHTHESDGTIHVEAGDGATLGQFFQVWGVPFGDKRLGPYRARGAKAVQMWVDGKPSRAFAGLELRDEQQVVVSYGRRTRSAPGT